MIMCNIVEVDITLMGMVAFVPIQALSKLQTSTKDDYSRQRNATQETGWGIPTQSLQPVCPQPAGHMLTGTSHTARGTWPGNVNTWKHTAHENTDEYEYIR